MIAVDTIVNVIIIIIIIIVIIIIIEECKCIILYTNVHI